MTSAPDEQARRVGLVRVRQHCTFTWQAAESGGGRTAEVTPTHCPECVAELQERGYRLRYEGRRTDEHA